MADFYVRAGFSCPLVRKCVEESGETIINSLFELLPDQFAADLLFERFTFGLVRMTAETKEECADAVKAAWDELYPDDPDGLNLMIVPDDKTDGADLMQAVFKLYYGAEEYQRLANDLYGIIPGLKKRGGLDALRRQSYLFAIDPGCGFTTILSSFGDFLRRTGVYEDESEARTYYIEYKVGKETVGGVAGVDDVISALIEGKAEQDKNVIGLDISYFLEDDKFDELRAFSHRLNRLQSDYIFAFRIPFLEKSALDRVAAVLSDIMLIRVVQIPPLDDMMLLEYMWDDVRRLGYRADRTLADAFFELIRKEKKDGRFYGFKTAEKTVKQIVLQKAAHDAAEGKADGSDDLIRASDVSALLKNEKSEKNGYEALAELIGMEEITERVREIVSQVKMSMADEKLDRPCIHMRFLGSPGTGKTTVARIVGQIFREEGILRKGAFMEYTARSLCAEYVGQTAVKTAAICRDAYGSVLFIDEAYALYVEDMSSNDYGKEALTTLISEMENHRDDMLVIMAGYTDDMETLMSGNAGLRSRMPYAIEFKNYTRAQLADIFMLMVRKHFKYTEALEKEAREYFSALSDEFIGSREFANARFVRNLYERTWSKGALRAALAGMDRVCLDKEDFLAASSEKEFKEKLKRQVRVGF